MSSWGELLDRAKPEEHVVQLYGQDDQLLTRHVSRYLAEGLRRGDGLVVIALPEHAGAIARQLTDQVPQAAEAVRDGRLMLLDAEATLGRLMVGDMPDRKLFNAVVGGLLEEVRDRAPSGRVRAFGEMVGVLWSDGQHAAAKLLEEYWNELLHGSVYSLFCAYPIDVFGEGFEMGSLGEVLTAHTHLFAGPATMLSSSRGLN